MKKNNQFFENSFKTLDEVSRPTDEQKEQILKMVLKEVAVASKVEPRNNRSPLKRIVTDYPWRFAFGAAFLQSSVCTLIFGTDYIRFVMSILGG
ncbi:hypothetical protein [Acetobacterium tundrae]|uniref:Uncharacterized protein n=1 Tax=Acetobacterium tundrae TaxID=132932 RepID=A0ABR6WJ21_9FIRM|nr:hypothetical protein [Acetobacterium tundrae]MBC3796488.1 hypothetical protein [Acetobacterium tundrae]